MGTIARAGLIVVCVSMLGISMGAAGAAAAPDPGADDRQLAALCTLSALDNAMRTAIAEGWPLAFGSETVPSHFDGDPLHWWGSRDGTSAIQSLENRIAALLRRNPGLSLADCSRR